MLITRRFLYGFFHHKYLRRFQDCFDAQQHSFYRGRTRMIHIHYTPKPTPDLDFSLCNVPDGELMNHVAYHLDWARREDVASFWYGTEMAVYAWRVAIKEGLVSHEEVTFYLPECAPQQTDKDGRLKQWPPKTVLDDFLCRLAKR